MTEKEENIMKRDAFISACLQTKVFIELPAIFESELRLMRIQKCAESPLLTSFCLTN